MCSNDVVIVVPTYKEKFDYFEKVSVEQLFKVLGNYTICLVIPNSLKPSYEEIKTKKYIVEKFDDDYFSGIEAYGRLCLSVEFYERFIQYRYILIYQLDAFVFSDRLEEFISCDYDYIGAPWKYSQFHFVNVYQNSWYVGNGGFSLRKTETVLKLIKERYIYFEECPGDIEDVRICSCASREFRVAPLEIAQKFSIETNVSEELKNGLPFGCHAWKKYDYHAWKKYIEKEGYILPDVIDEDGRKDFDVRLAKYRTFCEKRAHYWKYTFDVNKFKKDILEAFVGEERSYAIWGIGICGKTLFSIMNSCGLDIKIIVDSNKSNTSYKECKIISPSFFRSQVMNYRLIVALWKADDDIIRFLSSIGCEYKKDYIRIEDIKEIALYKDFYPQNRKQLAI